MFARLRFSSSLGIGLIVAATTTAGAEEFAPFVAEVSADALMVRSGPSRNYYPVTKLGAGDRVQVVGEESGWYAIVPPDDCFSLISQDYVDPADGGRTGVVNGNAVRVRAGSRLDPKKYAVQRKLSKGDEVEITGDDGEGYYKIVPPQGAVLWLHGDFVTRVVQPRLAAEPKSKREPIPAAVPKAEPSPIDLVRRSSPTSDRKAYEAPVQSITEPVASASELGNTQTEPPIIPRDKSSSEPVVSSLLSSSSNPNSMPSISQPSTAREIPPADWSRSATADANEPAPAQSPNVVRSVTPPIGSPGAPVQKREPVVKQYEPSSGDSGVVYSFAPDATEADRLHAMDDAPRQASAGPTRSIEPREQAGAEAGTSPTVQDTAQGDGPMANGQFANDQMTSDQLASSTQPGFVSSEFPSHPDPVIERPDPYAGIDVQRENGVIKVVVDPIEPGRELTVEQYRRRLMDLDEVFKSQLEKPAHQRDYVGLRNHFAELSAQDVDMYTRLYAARRIEQINALEDTSLALVKLESMSDQVTAIRRQHMLERSQLQLPQTPIERGFDAKGELRESLIYSSPVGPRRYRLVDPTQPTPRTLCYVEAAPDGDIQLDQYLGQVVGVFARDKYLQTGDVDPIAVLVADKLIVLNRGQTSTIATPVQVQGAGAGQPGYENASGDRRANGYGSAYDVQPGIIQPDSMRSATSNRAAPPVLPAAPPADDGEMIEMVPMEEYTPVASGDRQ